MRKNGMQNLTRTIKGTKGAWVHNDTGVYATVKKLGRVAMIKTFNPDGELWDTILCVNNGYNVNGFMLGMIKQCNDGKSKYSPQFDDNKRYWRD